MENIVATQAWGPWSSEMLKDGAVLFYNNLYHVIARSYEPVVEGQPRVIHLSIRDNNRSTKHDWRDFQRIKNELVGPDVEMMEIYPKEEHKVDLSNQYHLWGYESTQAIFQPMGFGWMEGRKIWDGKSAAPVFPGSENVVQRPTNEPTEGTFQKG